MPDRQEIRQTLIELLEADTGEKYSDLEDSTDLRAGLGLDSVDVVSVVSQIERRFRIRLSHEELIRKFCIFEAKESSSIRTWPNFTECASAI